MKEKGFATIFSLCLILIIALIVKGINESEMNHAYETADFQAEMELQNAADRGIYEAANLVINEQVELTLNNTPTLAGSRKKFREKFGNKDYGSIIVETWGEHVMLNSYLVKYNVKKTVKGKTVIKNIAKETGEPAQEVYVFLSKAEPKPNDKRWEGKKIYRRSFAYVLAEKNPDGTHKDTTIHFMEVPMSDYEFE